MASWVLREETELALWQIQYTGTKTTGLSYISVTGTPAKFNVTPGSHHSVPRYVAVQLLKRCDVEYDDPTAVLERAERVLVVRQGGMGDVLLTLPTMCELARRYPQLSIEYATDPRHQRILQTCSAISRSMSVTDVYEYAPYDALFDLRMLVEAADDRDSVHRVDIFARRFGFDTLPSYAMPYTVLEDEQVWAAGQVADLPRPLIGVQVRGSIPRRTLSVSAAHTLVQALRERGWGVVVLDDLADAQWDGQSTLNATGQTSPAQLFALLAQCDGVVAGDSGIMHAANALGVPTVGLFGAVWSHLRVKGQPRCVTIDASEFGGCKPCNDAMHGSCGDGGLTCVDRIPVTHIMERLEACL
jgi:ADP-heptose:LPS heptosyltransferase